MKTCIEENCNRNVFTHNFCKVHSYKYYKLKPKKEKVKKPKRKKLPSLSKMKKDLDDIYSPYIRMRDCNERGEGNCFVCGRKGLAYANQFTEFGGLQNGHWIPRRLAPALVFHEWNSNAICSHCNTIEPPEYTIKMQKKYGYEKVEEFISLQHNFVWKPSRPELENLIREYIGKFLVQCDRIGHVPTIVEQRVIDKYETK